MVISTNPSILVVIEIVIFVSIVFFVLPNLTQRVKSIRLIRKRIAQEILLEIVWSTDFFIVILFTSATAVITSFVNSTSFNHIFYTKMFSREFYGRFST